jgi:hypothetical protein
LKPIQAYQSIFLNILKLILAIGTLGFIWYKLIYAYHIGQLWSSFQLDFTPLTAALIVFIFLLMPVNWHLEAKKWKLIIGKHEAVTTKRPISPFLQVLPWALSLPIKLETWPEKLFTWNNCPKLKVQ